LFAEVPKLVCKRTWVWSLPIDFFKQVKKRHN